jgi:hypothetical protein
VLTIFSQVSRLEAKKHPEPKNPMDMNVVQLLAMGRTCPYLPTNFREFLRVASEMGSALQPIGHEGVKYPVLYLRSNFGWALLFPFYIYFEQTVRVGMYQLLMEQRTMGRL